MLKRPFFLQIDRISIHDLRARIARLKNCDLTALSVQELEQRVGILLDQIPLHAYKLTLNGVYRARRRAPEAPEFMNANELWYPPAPRVLSMGRLNDAGQSVFYAANTPHTAIFETRPEIGQTYTVLLARTKARWATLSVFFLGITQSQSPDAISPQLGLSERKASLEAELGLGNFKKYKLLDEWLTEAVTKIVAPNNPELYKPTVALANKLFKAPLDGIQYPSVATGNNGINLCLLPNRADELFEPDEVWEFRIENEVIDPKSGKRLFKTRSLRKSKSIESEGRILWGDYGVDVGEVFLNNFARGQLKSLADL